MGKFYTRHRDKLFIYVTRNDPMLDVELFPPDLSLFPPERAEMIRDKIAIAEVKDDDSFGKAELVLQLNGFRENELPTGVLYHYFSVGEESVIESGGLFLAEVGEQGGSLPVMPSGASIDVIIPRSVIANPSSTDSYVGDLPDWREFVNINEHLGERDADDAEFWLASEEEVMKTLMDCMESKGFLFNYRYAPRESRPASIQTDRVDEGSYPERDILRLLTELNRLLKTFMKEHSTGIEEEWGDLKRTAIESEANELALSRKVMKAIMGGLMDVESDLER